MTEHLRLIARQLTYLQYNTCSYFAVFSAGSDTALLEQLRKAVDAGHWSLKKRQNLAQWAVALGAQAGARYVLSILDYSVGTTKRPLPPWEVVQSVEEM